MLSPLLNTFRKYRIFLLVDDSYLALTKVQHTSKAMRCHLFVLLIAALVSCRYDVEETLYGSNCPDAIEAYEGNVRLLLEAHCTTCHGGAFPESGLDLTNYASARQATLEGSLLNALVLPESNSLSMPPNGALDSCEIALLQNWAALGAPEF